MAARRRVAQTLLPVNIKGRPAEPAEHAEHAEPAEHAAAMLAMQDEHSDLTEHNELAEHAIDMRAPHRGAPERRRADQRRTRILRFDRKVTRTMGDSHGINVSRSPMGRT
jgi:hypothetical protein